MRDGYVCTKFTALVLGNDYSLLEARTAILPARVANASIAPCPGFAVSICVQSHYPPPYEQSAGLLILLQSNVANSYTAHDMSSHPPKKWLQLTPDRETTSAPQQESNHTQIPLTNSRATTPSLPILEALNQTSEAEEADNSPDTKKAALQKKTKVITEQWTKL